MNLQHNLHRDLRGTVTLMMLAVIMGIITHGSSVHGAWIEEPPVSGRESNSTVTRQRPSSESSADPAFRWKSRRTPGKWVQVSATKDKSSAATSVPSGNTRAVPGKTGNVKETVEKPRQSRSAPKPVATGRKSASMVFIAGKSASEDQSRAAADRVVAESRGPMSESTAESDEARSGVSHEDASTHRDTAKVSDTTSEGHEDHAPKTEPQYFNEPMHDTPGLYHDDSANSSAVVSTTEQVKQLLLRHKMELEAPAAHGGDSSAQIDATYRESQTNGDHGNAAQGHAGHKSSTVPGHSLDLNDGGKISSLSPSIEADLRSDNPILRERAKRFLRLREQLLQLKARVKSVDSSSEEVINPPGHAGSSEPPTHHDSSTTSKIHGEQEHRNSSHDGSTSGQGESGQDESAHSDGGHSDGGHSDGGHSDKGHDDAGHGSNHSDVHGNEHAASGSGAHSTDPASESLAPGHQTPSHAAESPDAGLQDSGDEGSHAMEAHGDSTPGHAGAHIPEAHASAGAISDPIDRVSLGNNLYAMGEFPAAHKAYLSVNPDELSAEQQFWTEYQIANCLRRMGETAEASNRFRKLASQPEAGWLSERAAWWVSVLEQIRRVENALATETSPEVSKGAATPKRPISGSSKEVSHDNSHH